MPSITFYHTFGSPPCRAVELLANHLDIKLSPKEVSLTKGEHLKEDYLKLNPQHTIPTIKDGNFVLWESRAILTYLVSSYGKDSKLYPEDVKARATVNRLLYFDLDVLYRRFADYIFPVFFGGQTTLDKTKKEKLIEGLDLLETFLSGHKFAASDSLTIADFTLVVSVTTIKETDIVDLSKYKKINEWISHCEDEIKGYAENYKSAAMFGQFAQDKFKVLTSK